MSEPWPEHDWEDVAERDDTIAELDAEIARLRAMVGELSDENIELHLRLRRFTGSTFIKPRESENE